jgi:hypothetical protein
VERFWAGEVGSDRGVWCRRLLAGSKWIARCASCWVGLVHQAGWVSRTMARWLVGCISYRGCTHV